jgi:UDP-N-acetylmuramate dehydrogenase
VLTQRDVQIEYDAEIPTWFGIGGRARRLAQPASVEEVARCIELDPLLRVLGDGANLLVDDEGVDELVIAMTRPEMQAVRFHGDSGGSPLRLTAMAGARLPKLILECIRRGLAGLEGLGGIPASLGGAAIMNAGGAFGQISDSVARIHGFDRRGNPVVLERPEIAFGYRHSGLNALIITEVELELTPGDPAALRQRLKEVMAYKKTTQPMAEKSAGCVFKNPTLDRDVDGVGVRGQRVSAGMLLDRAGCKGLRVGSAEISHGHANFFVTRPGARARDVIELMDAGRLRVAERFGIELEPEVVVWRREGRGIA